jgi:hypothetical protein
MKKNIETLRKKILSVRDIQGLFSHNEALLSFWDLKLRVTMANSQSQNE